MKEKAHKKAPLSIDNLLSKADNKFLLSNAIAGRAKQVSDGSLPYISDFDPTNPIVTAIKEIANDRVRIKALTAPPKETLFKTPRKEERKEVSILEDLVKTKAKKSPVKAKVKKKKSQ